MTRGLGERFLWREVSRLDMSKVFQYFQLARYPDTVSLHLTKSECTPPIRELEVTSLGKTRGVPGRAAPMAAPTEECAVPRYARSASGFLQKGRSSYRSKRTRVSAPAGE